MDGTDAASAGGRRVAVLSEWFEAVGGAERTLLATLSAFEDARAWALWFEDGVQPPAQLRESWLARTPVKGHKALALPLMPLVWRSQTRERFDVVLSLSHALTHTARLRLQPGGVHLSYVHTPPRYLHLPEIDQRKNGAGQRAAVHLIKKLERATSRHVTGYAANSQEVRHRIQEFWGRDARVINPPVRTDVFTPAAVPVPVEDRSYLFGVGRWITYKRFDFMIDVADRVGLPLVIAGGGPLEQELRAQAERASVPVRFAVRPSDEDVRELMRGARALLFPAHEDFGIVPVEAQACGTPVVGLRRGGLLETVVDGVSGVLVDELDLDAFADAVHRAGSILPTDARKNAEAFGADRFVARIRQWVDEELAAAG
jgi:glycosyltransferase involved in cell wall biosynthesis